LINKLEKLTNKLNGKTKIQRNWELQFVGKSNQENLLKHLASPSLQNLIPSSVINKYQAGFYGKDPLQYAHPVSMLLTISAFLNQNRN